MGKFVVKKTKTGFKFNLKAGNGEIIATSEVYNTKGACLNGVKSVINNAPKANFEDQTAEGFEKAKHPKFEMYTDKAGEFRFRLKATNGQVIGTSEVYNSMASCKNGIAAVKRCSVGEIEDTTVEGAAPVKHPKFVISTDKAGKFRFNLKARNGEIILTSQGYASKDTCINGINSVKKNAPESPIVVGE